MISSLCTRECRKAERKSVSTPTCPNLFQTVRYDLDCQIVFESAKLKVAHCVFAVSSAPTSTDQDVAALGVPAPLLRGQLPLQHGDLGGQVHLSKLAAGDLAAHVHDPPDR